VNYKSDIDPEDGLTLVVSSNWASNMGNPFFEIAAEHLLSDILKNDRVHRVAHISDVARNPSKKQKQNAFDYIKYAEPDRLVLCGPMMGEKFVDWYEPILDEMNTDTMDLILLSVGSINYDGSEVNRCQTFLEKYPPKVLFTRDSFTYDAYHEFAEYSYDGIDLAFFSPDIYPGYPTPKLDPYVTFTFDRVAEPDVEWPDPTDPTSIRVGDVKYGRVKRKAQQYVRQNYPETIEGHTIVRPTHGIIGRSERSLYRKPNTFFAQTPDSYLNIYRNTQLTLSGRVHACVPTLAYGGTAQLFTDSPRSRLFERVGAENIHKNPVSLDMDELNREKDQLVSELERAFTED